MGALAALAVLIARRCTGGPHSRWSPRVPRLLLLRAALALATMSTNPGAAPCSAVVRSQLFGPYDPLHLSPARLPAARTPPAGFCVIL